MIKFPHPSAVAQNGWTHQVNWQGLNGPDIWVPCFSRHTTKESANFAADRLRNQTGARDVQVNPIPKEKLNNDK